MRFVVFVYLTEDLQFVPLLLIGCQCSKLLQQHRAGRCGDVQEVLEDLGDGARRDAVLIGPVTNHPWRDRTTQLLVTPGETEPPSYWSPPERQKREREREAGFLPGENERTHSGHIRPLAIQAFSFSGCLHHPLNTCGFV